ncbi:MAG TPA: hypothetical protein VFE62_07040, partial [Gemmataceae bacterium]|nr:hypothetical protein [Gemmataceae bacterium]
MLPVLFGFTLFFSSALLFLVQPMIGRTLLPHLGGNPLAWSACLVFFQATLLAGYVYADSLHRFRGVRWQPILQTVLLLVAAALCLIGLAGDGMLRFLAPRLDLLDSWPVLNMLALLVVGIGFPFLVLAAVGPLVQRWFAQTAHPRASDPYFLFVASNLGGIAALVLYPLVVERFTPMWVQWLLWKIGLAALALLLLGLAVCVWRSRANPEFEPPAPSDDPNTPATPILVGRGPATWPRRIYWLIAAALPVALMMSVTDYLTLDVSPIPLFWAAPLGLYLIAFSQAFARCAPVANGGFVLKLILHILYGILFLGALVATVIAAMSRSLDFNGPDGVVFGFACLVTLTMLLMPSSWLRIVQPISVVIVVLTQANMVALMSQMSIINILL